jgi:X-Pro dipeptidyl-peptidase
MHARRLPLLALLLATLPATAHATVVNQTLSIPVLGGTARISVEIRRDDAFDASKQPIILTYSPYNTLSEDPTPGGTVANDSIAAEYVPKGYARAVADVLGTRDSTGCWDYGGPKEQQSGAELVTALSKLPWSNGKVGMIGASYDGTTANMVAVVNPPGLAAIAPQAAINHWYGYAYQDGVRYAGNSKVPTDEGIDTPLGFDFGLARTPPTHPDQDSLLDLPTGRYNPCDSVDHTMHGYDTTPDYDTFWQQRDYRKDADKIRVPVLVTHGWQDYNVKQSEGIDMYDAITNAPFKILYMWQGPHGIPSTSDYDQLLQEFWAKTLKGVDNGIENEDPVHTVGRTGTTADKVPTDEAAWPPVGTQEVAWPIAGTATTAASYTDTGTSSEELELKQGLDKENGWLFYKSAPLTSAIRFAGSPYVEATITDSADHGQLSPTLYDIGPDGTAVPISRGHLNLQYRNGVATAVPVPTNTPVTVRVRLAPQDQTIPAGHSIGLVFASSNTVWAIPDEPAGYSIAVQGAGPRLLLPVVG